VAFCSLKSFLVTDEYFERSNLLHNFEKVMVVTRLREVTTKGKEWVNTSVPCNENSNNATTTSHPSTFTSYWEYASNSIHDATASAIGSMVSSFFGTERSNAFQEESSSFYNQPLFSQNSTVAPLNTTTVPTAVARASPDQTASTIPTPSSHAQRRRSSLSSSSTSSSPWNKTPHSDLLWMFRNNKNPYNAVRGRDTHPSALTAVRSLVALVPTTNRTEEEMSRRYSAGHSLTTVDEVVHDDDRLAYDKAWSTKSGGKSAAAARTSTTDETSPFLAPYALGRPDSLIISASSPVFKRPRTLSSASETASQLAEGSIRALRDLALDEAVELQAALRFWNNRWERPLLSWLEAGPLGTIFAHWMRGYC
jgi:hypothetical protein